MKDKIDLRCLKSLSKEDLTEQIEENDRRGQLLIANPQYLTEEQLKEREEFIEELNDFSEEDTISFEEGMNELFAFVEELEEEYKYECIQNKIAQNIL